MIYAANKTTKEHRDVSFYLVNVVVTNGEFQHQELTPVCAEDEKQATEQALYLNERDKLEQDECGRYTDCGGQLGIKVKAIKEISESTFREIATL